MFAPLVAKAKPNGSQPSRAVDQTRAPGRDIGNQAMIRLHAPQVSGSPIEFQAPPPAAAQGLAIQAKLKVGAIDDPLEREADRVADQVMRMEAADVARVPADQPQMRGMRRGGPASEEGGSRARARPEPSPRQRARDSAGAGRAARPRDARLFRAALRPGSRRRAGAHRRASRRILRGTSTLTPIRSDATSPSTRGGLRQVRKRGAGSSRMS